MIDGLKPYPVMKDSGEPWLGTIPEHWELPRIKTLLHERVQKGFPDEPLLAATQTKGVVRKTQYENRTVLALKDLHLLKLVHVGDFVISLRSFQGGIEYARERGIISPAYTVLYPIQPDSHGFLAWLFKSKPFVQNLSNYVTGIRQGQNIDYEKLSRSELPIPPLREGAAIVRFLDHADRRIRRYIRAKQKLMMLLEEQKQAIIHHAVTRGIDPNVRLKPSGVPWLGDIPVHWDVWRVSRFARVGNGSTPSRSMPAYWNGGTYPWLNSSQVNRGFIDSADQFVTPAALRECHLPRIRAGSLLVAITGQGKTRGMAAVLRFEATINQHIAFITPRTGAVSPEFLHLAFTGAYRTLRALSEDYAATKGALTCEDLKRFKIALPPQQEQAAVIDHIHSQTQTLDTTVNRTERELFLLREYRTRLIADVVTGKLDVREASAKLPDQAEEIAVLDVEEELEGGDDTTDNVSADAETEEAA